MMQARNNFRQSNSGRGSCRDRIDKRARPFGRSKGQAIAEGVVALWLITAMVVGGVLLLLGVGTAMYYKLKIAFAAGEGARFGSSAAFFLGTRKPDYTDAQLKVDVTEVVNQVLVGIGLPKAESVGATIQTIGNKDFCTVSVSVGALKIISGGILPNAIALTDTAQSACAREQPPIVIGLTMAQSPTGVGFYIPAFGFTRAGNLETGVQPRGPYVYYAAGIQAASSNGVEPAVNVP